MAPSSLGQKSILSTTEIEYLQFKVTSEFRTCYKPNAYD
jgi:hypothetical protein